MAKIFNFAFIEFDNEMNKHLSLLLLTLIVLLQLGEPQPKATLSKISGILNNGNI